MSRSWILMASLSIVGCKGETVVNDDQSTVNALDVCRKTVEEKNKLIAALQDENARLMRGGGSGGEIVVTIQGDAVNVKPAKPGDVLAVDEKAAAAASKEFFDIVGRSRGAIQKCYEQALKKNPNLQAKTMTLNITASFAQGGQYRDASFSPSLGETFDACMKALASKWALSGATPAMTLKQPVSLTPS